MRGGELEGRVLQDQHCTRIREKADVSEFIARTVRKEDYKGSEVPRNLRNAGAG